MTRTQGMTNEWHDNDGVKHVTAWAKAVRNAMLRGGAEFQRQKAWNQAENNWNKPSCAPPTLDCTKPGKLRAQELKVT
jgi:hypothetical protein